MPVMMIMKWPGVTPEQYDRARAIVNWEGDVPAGALFHVIAFDGDGLRVTDVWDSAEDFQRFTEERLTPGVSQLNLPGEPIIEIYPTHRIFAPGFTAAGTTPNKALVCSVFSDAINNRNPALLLDIAAPDYVNHNLPVPNPGPEGMRQVIEMFIAGFPDLQVTVKDVIAEQDRVCTRGTMTGTQQGEFMGVAPTGTHIAIDYIDVWRIAGGKLAENWVQIDLLGLMQQLGVAPRPAAAMTMS
jgi:predicted ester cyclase